MSRSVFKVPAKVLLYLWLPTLLIVLWWFLPPSHSIYFPALWVLIDNIRHQWIWHLASTELVPTLKVLGLGYAIAVCGGIVLGLILRLVPVLYELSLPLISFFRGLPAIALIPPLLLILGLGATFKVGIVVLGAIQPVLLNTYNGLQSIDEVQAETARSYGLSGLRRIFAVMLPAASPQIVAGARTALQASILLVVASEIVGSTAGVGYVIVNAQQSFDGPGMWGGMIILGVLGIVLNLLFVIAERWVLSWYFGMRATEGRLG